MAERFSFPGVFPTRWLGPFVQGPVLACAMILGMAGLVAPLTEAVQSPLSLLQGENRSAEAAHPAAQLPLLIRLTRSHRELVAARFAHDDHGPEALAQVRADQDRAMRSLRSIATRLSTSEAADIHALGAEWDQLKRASSEPSTDAAALFALHTRVMDRQMALLDRIKASRP